MADTGSGLSWLWFDHTLLTALSWKGFLYHSGMDPKCDYNLGSVVDSAAIWIAADTCLCSRQAVALLIYSFVCSYFSLLLGINLPGLSLKNGTQSWYWGLMVFVSLRPRTERPEEWVPDEAALHKRDIIASSDECSDLLQVGDAENGNITDIFSIHSEDVSGNPLSPFVGIYESIWSSGTFTRMVVL